MKRTRLKNTEWSEENERKYEKQRNYNVLLSRTIKRESYSNLNGKNISDNKKAFWKSVKSFLSEKIVSTEKISLIDSADTFSNDHETVRVFNTFFSNAMSSLKTPEYTNHDLIPSNVNLAQKSLPFHFLKLIKKKKKSDSRNAIKVRQKQVKIQI